MRLHTTQFARDKSNTPSGITLKIRKHIRTRRLEDIRQLGVDRVRLNHSCFFEGILCCSMKYVILPNIIKCMVPTFFRCGMRLVEKTRIMPCNHAICVPD